MKKTTLAIVCLLGCTALSLSAQEAEKKQLHEIKVKFDKAPDGLANYYSGYYYYNGNEIYNMRNYLMYTGNRINALTINPSGSSYAFIDSKKDKNTVDVFSLMTKDQQLGKITTNKLFKPLAICYSPNAKFLYVMGSDSKIHIFETRKTREVKSFAINEPATRLDASPNGFFLIASTKDKLQVINLENETVRTTLPLKADFKDVAFSSNSKQMAVLAADGTCDVYDTKTFTVSKHFDAMGIAERCFFHPENKYLAIVTGDQRVAFINLLNEDDRQYVDAKDDFAPGRFKVEESNAAQAMLAIVKKALEEDFAKYTAEGKQVKIQIIGMADALPFSRTVAYDGCYGDFEQEPVHKNGELSNITVTKSTGIGENDQLAYLRAMGVKDYIEKNIPALQKMKTSYDTYIEVSENKGGEYRRIGVKFTFIDVF